MNKYLFFLIVLIIAIPLIALIIVLPSWFLGGHKQIQVTLVTTFLTFDGIMVAVTAFFTPLKPNYFGRSILALSIEFVASATGFLLSFRGIIDTPNAYLHTGTAIEGGLVLMFAGLISLFVLMIGTYVGFLFQKPADANITAGAVSPTVRSTLPAKIITPRTRLQVFFWIILLSSVTILILGLIEFLSNFVAGLAIVAVGLGFLGAAFALRSENLIQEIRLGEIDQKIAMMYGYSGNTALSPQRTLWDIQALERYSTSITCAQAQKIQTEGARIVDVYLAANPKEAEEAKKILNRILLRFGLSV